MFPILHWPGVMTPGRSGPSSRTPGWSRWGRAADARHRGAPVRVL